MQKSNQPSERVRVGHQESQGAIWRGDVFGMGTKK